MKPLKIDFGSGYNPCPDYKTCDCVSLPTLNYYSDPETFIISDRMGNELPRKSTEEIRCRNVVHHIQDLKAFFCKLSVYTRTLRVIEPKEWCFNQNVIQDRIWYRWMLKRPEIWFSETWRDYVAVAKEFGFPVVLSHRSLNDFEEETVFLSWWAAH